MKKKAAKPKKITVCMVRSAGLAMAVSQLDQATEAALGTDEVGKVLKHVRSAIVEVSHLGLPALTKALDKTREAVEKSKSRQTTGMALEKVKELTQRTMIRTFQKCGAGELFRPRDLILIVGAPPGRR
jgi:hypothetical protein